MSETKMRDYVDGIRGTGSWDRMHDLIDRGELLGWSLPPVEVDGRQVNIFPGTNREVTLEHVQNEIRKAFAHVDDEDEPDTTPLSRQASPELQKILAEALAARSLPNRKQEG